MNLISEGRKALVERLGIITPGNGFNSDAGTRVKSGWVNEIIKDADAAYPLIVVQRAKGQAPSPGPNALKISPGFYVVGAVSVGTDYEDALDDLELDLLRCLIPEEKRFPKWLPPGVLGIKFGDPEQFPPAEGLSAATVLIPVYLPTIIQAQ
ncbi:hypothetical protein ACIGCM_03635 [Pseudomonas sp. NPDC078700]|uniref:hypothetical protein n=1 Tax=Pseudomonas sp. NPDC078700 TaxID=3364424 RepID=UPI0037C89924